MSQGPPSFSKGYFGGKIEHTPIVEHEFTYVKQFLELQTTYFMHEVQLSNMETREEVIDEVQPLQLSLPMNMLLVLNFETSTMVQKCINFLLRTFHQGKLWLDNPILYKKKLTPHRSIYGCPRSQHCLPTTQKGHESGRRRPIHTL